MSLRGDRGAHTLGTASHASLVVSAESPPPLHAMPCPAAPALREIDMNAGAVTKEWTLPSLAGAIVLSNSNPKLMFTAGGEEGKPGGIRALQFPITPSAGGVDFLGAAAPVAKMMLSHDDAYMFVAGTDGCLIVFDVRDPAGRVPVSEGSVKVPWAEETLVILQVCTSGRRIRR